MSAIVRLLTQNYAFDESSSSAATFNGVNSWISFTVTELTVPFIIRNDSSGTAQTVTMFTDSSGSSAAGGSWGSTGTNNLSPAVTTTVIDTYTLRCYRDLVPKTHSWIRQ